MIFSLNKPILAFWLSWLSLLVFQPLVTTHLVTQKVPTESNKITCQSSINLIIVKVLSDSEWGSGIIIDQQKNKQTGQFDYLVVTNNHVIESTQPPDNIITFDQTVYPAQRLNFNLGETDLVILKFSSLQPYKIANFAPAFTEGRLSQATKVTAVGYPIEDSKGLVCLEGRVNALLSESLIGGSQIGISANVEQGMSGGALLDENGQVVGILERENNPPWGYPRAYPLTNNLPLVVPEEVMLPSSWAIPIETLVAKVKPYRIELPLAWQKNSKLVEFTSENQIINQLNHVKAELIVNDRNRQGLHGILRTQQDLSLTLNTQRNGIKLLQQDIITDIPKESMIKPTLKVIDLDNDQEPEIIVDIQYKNQSCLYDTLSYIYRYNELINKYEKVIQHHWKNIPFYHLKDIDDDGKLEMMTFDGRFSCLFSQEYDTYQQREALPLQIWRYDTASDKLELVQPSDYPLEYKNHALKLLSYYQTQSNHWSSHRNQLQALLAAYAASKLSIQNDQRILTDIQMMYQFPDQEQYFQKLTNLLQKTEYVTNE